MGLFSHIALRQTICFQNYCDCPKHSGYRQLITDLKPGEVSNSFSISDKSAFLHCNFIVILYNINKVVTIIQATDYRASDK